MKRQKLGMLVAIIVALAAIVLLFVVNMNNGYDHQVQSAPLETEEPTAEPTEEPTEEPTDVPTAEPTIAPTAEPTEEPTAEPTEKPTDVPKTPAPTPQATLKPTLVAQTTPVPTVRATPTVEPTAVPALYGKIIGIDPGHQEHGNSEQEAIAPGSSETKPKVSSGTTGRYTGIPEYVTNLEISLQLRDALEAEGATVIMSRETHDVDISNQERAIMMNEAGCDLVLRLHCNGSENSGANGIGLYIRKTGACAEESEAAAELLLPAMVEATGAESDGIFKRDTYTGLNWSEVPCILVEMGFMTNRQEDENLNDPAYQQLLVKGMMSGVIAYLSDAALE